VQYKHGTWSVAILNPNLLPSKEYGVNPGRRSSKSTYLNKLEVRKPLVPSISHRREKLRLYNLV
jgi:hypothetical protein